jgi:serine protease
VVSAEPNRVRRILGGESLFDPYQWNLFDRGTPSGRAVSQFGIQASAAWNHTKGEGITVAVLDTGVAYEDYDEFYQAPALATARFTDGYDVVDHDDHPNDYDGHGTHVTGILADNQVDGGGTIGVAPDVTVMPVRVMGSEGSGTQWDIAEGIRWAADHGAGVLNMSLGGPQGSSIEADACRYAAARECVLVVAAGNENAAEVSYPAYYPDCIAVGSTGFDGFRAPYSNRGKRLFVMAPGGNLQQDLNRDGRGDGIMAQTFDPRRGYDSFDYFYPYQGTSMAAPQVAGVAALIRSANPALSAKDVRQIIQETALHLGAEGRNTYYGYGLVDASSAVEAALAKAQEQDPP